MTGFTLANVAILRHILRTLFGIVICIGSVHAHKRKSCCSCADRYQWKIQPPFRNPGVSFTQADWIVVAGKFPCRAIGGWHQGFGRLSSRINTFSVRSFLGSPCISIVIVRSISLNFAFRCGTESHPNSIYVPGLFFFNRLSGRGVICRHCLCAEHTSKISEMPSAAIFTCLK